MSKFETLFNQYALVQNEDQLQRDVDAIIQTKVRANCVSDVYNHCLGLIDLTSLNVTDSESSIVEMVDRINHFPETYPHLNTVPAICVFPNMVPVVKKYLNDSVKIASVAGGFPASQTFIEVKMAEVAMCTMEGADEIDVVINLGYFLDSKFADLYEELSEIKTACREAHLKVIIESGALTSSAQIMQASILALASGADFIKTSTGKTPISATPKAVMVMCKAIKAWYEKTGDRKSVV